MKDETGDSAIGWAENYIRKQKEKQMLQRMLAQVKQYYEGHGYSIHGIITTFDKKGRRTEQRF